MYGRSTDKDSQERKFSLVEKQIEKREATCK